MDDKIVRLLLKNKAKIKRGIESFGVYKDFKVEDTIIIVGTPRAGTTWLLELLETLPRYKSIFEPLHKYWFPQIKQIGLGSRPYIQIEKDQPEVKEYLQRIFTGKINSLYPSYPLTSSSIQQRLFAKKLIVKFIRANRILPWIVNNFQLKKIYFIIRHPCATIASQIETGIRGYHLPKKSQIANETFMKDVSKIPFVRNNEKFMKKMKELKTQEEILAVVWSLDNYIPLAHLKPYPWHMVIYEKLLTDGENEVKNIFNVIGEDLPTKTYKNLRKSSRTSMDKSNLNLQKQLSKWKNKLSKNQMERILKVVEWFGLDFYSEELEPDYRALKNWTPKKTVHPVNEYL